MRPKGNTHTDKHLSFCKTCKDGLLSLKNFEDVKVTRNRLSLGILEALLIKKLQPKINKQMFANSTNTSTFVWS